MTRPILIAGAGRIGCLIASLLEHSGDYEAHLIDASTSGPQLQRTKQFFPKLRTAQLDVTDAKALQTYIRENGIQAAISSLPYYCNIDVAKVARETNIHYFDLTEDVNVTAQVREIAAGANSAFVPQCGLAPGYINMAANSLMTLFDEVESVQMRVGALPEFANNSLQYALNWSTDGVINEYGNWCEAIENGEMIRVKALDGLELVQLDGCMYEAFNTSGGLGSLPELHAGKVKSMNYKTLRYPGHCEKVRFLMDDLKLNSDRDTLKRILERAIPTTMQDVVVVYVSVTGTQEGKYVESNYLNKVYPQVIADVEWTAIQVTTASGVCGVMDMIFANEGSFHGYIFQEQFSLNDFLDNRFGQHYDMN